MKQRKQGFKGVWFVTSYLTGVQPRALKQLLNAAARALSTRIEPSIA